MSIKLIFGSMNVVLLTGLILATATPVVGSSYYLTPDVPTSLGGLTATPRDVVRSDSGVYGLEWSLPAGTDINALYRLDNGSWLLSFESPVILGDTLYEPRDVVHYNGAVYTMFMDGFAAGIPDSSGIDAVFSRTPGPVYPIILSFDVPTALGIGTVEPADLVDYHGGTIFDLRFDASAVSPPVPPSSNVTGADFGGEGSLVITFDVPTTLGVNTFVPGELVSWDGMKFTSFFQDPAWPAGSSVAGLAFLANPGPVEPTVRIRKSTVKPGRFILEWQPGCSFGAEDYGIYEGTLGVWYDHRAIDCHDDGGDFIEEVAPSAGDHYYLVVANNPNQEGLYGRDSDQNVRPAGAGPCAATMNSAPCP